MSGRQRSRNFGGQAVRRYVNRYKETINVNKGSGVKKICDSQTIIAIPVKTIMIRQANWNFDAHAKKEHHDIRFATASAKVRAIA